MDIQFIQFNDSLDINSAREIPELTPRSLEIVGLDFSSAIKVLINQAASPSFIIMNPNKIVAQVPNEYGDAVISDIVIVSSNFTASLRSLVSYEFGSSPKKISGLQVLMQTFIKVLMTTPGYDSFVQSIGGGVSKVVGTRSSHAGGPIISAVAAGVSQAADQIRAIQARTPRLADDERLVSATLDSLRFDPTSSTLKARVELYTQAGQLAVGNLEL